MTITWIDFATRLALAFILGAGIGIERQWLKSRSVLKTNVLVSLGAAMFVMMAAMIQGDSSPTRVAAQVVSGVGFLGAGVILREGASVRGINTAATLWCAAAIGSLVGSGFLLQAYCGTIAVIGANLLLRPVVQLFQPRMDETVIVHNESLNLEKKSRINQELPLEAELETVLTAPTYPETRYRCRLLCRSEAEAHVLALLLKSVREKGLILTAIHSKNIEYEDVEDLTEVEIKADFLSEGRSDELEMLEQVVSQLKFKARVHRVSWEFTSLRA